MDVTQRKNFYEYTRVNLKVTPSLFIVDVTTNIKLIFKVIRLLSKKRI